MPNIFYLCTAKMQKSFVIECFSETFQACLLRAIMGVVAGWKIVNEVVFPYIL